MKKNTANILQLRNCKADFMSESDMIIQTNVGSKHYLFKVNIVTECHTYFGNNNFAYTYNFPVVLSVYSSNYYKISE